MLVLQKLSKIRNKKNECKQKDVVVFFQVQKHKDKEDKEEISKKRLEKFVN